jgi:hypothetical protein
MKSIYRKAMEHLTLPPDALAKIQIGGLPERLPGKPSGRLPKQ